MLQPVPNDGKLPLTADHEYMRFEKREDGLYFEVLDGNNPEYKAKLDAAVRDTNARYGNALRRLPSN